MTTRSLPLDRATIRRAIAVCNRIAREWDRECKKRIAGTSPSGDDWSEASASSSAARQCARAIAALLDTPPIPHQDDDDDGYIGF